MCAGLLLGLAELAMSAGSVAVSPPLAFTLLVTCAGLVVGCAGALWLVGRRRGSRPTQAGLVGAMLGPLCAVGGMGPLRLATDGAGNGWVAFGGVAVLLVVATRAGTQLAARGEGVRSPAPLPTWAGTSLLLAGLSRSLHGGSDGMSLAAIPIGLGLAAAGLLGLVPRLRFQPSRSYSRLLTALVLVAGIAPFWPWLLPWLLLDEGAPSMGRWPPNLVIVALRAHHTLQNDVLDGAPLPTLELVAVSGVSYPTLAPESEASSLLRLPDGSPLASELRATGYATGAILTAPDRDFTSAAAVEKTDAQPGGRRLLQRSARWMAGAPLLLGPASPVLGLLGEGEALRTPAQVGAAAGRWLLSWRATRAPTPFFLLIDLRAPDVSLDAVDAGLRVFLQRLQDLLLAPLTVLVVAVEAPGAGGSGPSLRALVAPPLSWPRAKRLEVARPVWGRELSLALLRIARSDGQAPVSLPGLPQPLVPPKPMEQR